MPRKSSIADHCLSTSFLQANALDMHEIVRDNEAYGDCGPIESLVSGLAQMRSSLASAVQGTKCVRIPLPALLLSIHIRGLV